MSSRVTARLQVSRKLGPEATPLGPEATPEAAGRGAPATRERAGSEPPERRRARAAAERMRRAMVRPSAVRRSRDQSVRCWAAAEGRAAEEERLRLVLEAGRGAPAAAAEGGGSATARGRMEKRRVPPRDSGRRAAMMRTSSVGELGWMRSMSVERMGKRAGAGGRGAAASGRAAGAALAERARRVGSRMKTGDDESILWKKKKEKKEEMRRSGLFLDGKTRPFILLFSR